MVLKLTKLELDDIDRMNRYQLIETVLTSRDHLPEDLLQTLVQKPIDQLRLLVLAARVICVLRQLQQPARADHGDADSRFPLDGI